MVLWMGFTLPLKEKDEVSGRDKRSIHVWRRKKRGKKKRKKEKKRKERNVYLDEKK